ncbi:tyrosine-type recombinase/integrase [Sphingomonas solaris]|uniref:Tyrosine-type recombinase/integrase n=1 Tax=Alterirhizorhabdus solaris TaxID=2529389 RepID=A0A558R5S4_9SPHN|nr:tyrosine-type recombinase/integrase [Sphingomonas solaris]TVV74734.1 tyrosine-type recombinase/integrase [Sphingomonas solaris]
MAVSKAEALNEALDDWRKGESRGGPSTGSVAWLFNWYQGQRKFTKNRQKTQSDYRKLMEAVVSLPMKRGTFGERAAAKVGPEVADQLYEIFLPRGPRQAMYVVQVCRAVWNWASRYSGVTGIPTGQNPFAGMGVSYRPKDGNRATSRAEYEVYCVKAVELGFQSMATAAALAFELVQRVWDAFGIPDPKSPGDTQEEVDRGIKWEDYRAGRDIVVVQSKTGKRIKLPLVDVMPDGERVPLYPELEAQLAASWRPGAAGLIVVEERNGKPYEHRRMSTVHRKICDAAGLPAKMTFTGFRHGGATEIGDSGEADIRPISGHVQLSTTAIYNKVNEEKARRIAARRREHLIEIAGSHESLDHD